MPATSCSSRTRQRGAQPCDRLIYWLVTAEMSSLRFSPAAASMMRRSWSIAWSTRPPRAAASRSGWPNGTVLKTLTRSWPKPMPVSTRPRPRASSSPAQPNDPRRREAWEHRRTGGRRGSAGAGGAAAGGLAGDPALTPLWSASAGLRPEMLLRFGRVTSKQAGAESAMGIVLALVEQEADAFLYGLLHLVADLTRGIALLVTALEPLGVDGLPEPEVEPLGPGNRRGAD